MAHLYLPSFSIRGKVQFFSTHTVPVVVVVVLALSRGRQEEEEEKRRKNKQMMPPFYTGPKRLKAEGWW